MERYPMFLGWKNQYYENDYTTKHNLQIQCNPYQITNGIFHRTRIENFTIHMEAHTHTKPKFKRSWNRRIELEESNFQLETILQSYIHQDSIIMAQK